MCSARARDPLRGAGSPAGHDPDLSLDIGTAGVAGEVTGSAFHHLPADAVLARLATSQCGLSEAEATERLTRWGPDRLPEPKGKTHAAAQGAVLRLLAWCENAHSLNCRSETRSVFRIPLLHNPLLVAAVIGTQLLQIAVLAVPPLRELSSLQELSIGDGLRLGAVSIAVLAVMEAYKWIRRDRSVAR